MKSYTGSGDDGYTALLGKTRVPKYDLRPEAYGTVDELSSALGLARATAQAERSRQITLHLQRHLYILMTELAATRETADRYPKTSPDDVAALEHEIDGLASEFEIPREFVIPGGSVPGAAFDVARTIARRAERAIAKLMHKGELRNQEVLRYMNRLSSLLFILARYEDAEAGFTQATLAKESVE